MTKSTSKEHHDTQGTKPEGPHREGDGAKAISIDPVPKDPGNSRGGGDHPKHPHSGKSS